MNEVFFLKMLINETKKSGSPEHVEEIAQCFYVQFCSVHVL
jgi:hypothetical protein